MTSEAVTSPEVSDPVAGGLIAGGRAIVVRTCPNCSVEFQRPTRGPGGHKRFCSGKCRTTWSNREKAEGAALITVAKAWRAMRGSGELGKAAFAEMTSILDTLNARDRDDKRLPLNDKGPLKPYLTDLLADRYIDRARR